MADTELTGNRHSEKLTKSTPSKVQNAFEKNNTGSHNKPSFVYGYLLRRRHPTDVV